MLKGFTRFLRPAVGSRQIHIAGGLQKGGRIRIKEAAPAVAQKKAATRTVKLQKQSTTHAFWCELQNDAENDSLPPPESNIFFVDDHKPQFLNFNEALERVRIASQPEIFDCMENPLNLRIYLNMRTKKKTKFVSQYETFVTLPNQLDFLPSRRIIVVCENDSEAQKFLDAGASFAGSAELLSKLEHGAIHSEEFDTVIAHPSHAPAVQKLRRFLSERLPTEKNKRLGHNLDDMLREQKAGLVVKSEPIPGQAAYNSLDLVIGLPAWPEEKLRANISQYMEALRSAASARVEGSPFVLMELFVPPFDLKIPIKLDEFAQ